jgi:ABC-2 type transport system ATP-binding protein
MMMDILVPDEGRISLFGGGVGGRDLAHRIGYLPEERGLYKKMKVLDHLVFFGETKGVSPARARSKAAEWLARLGLSDWTDKKIEDLSKGMQQKVQFAGTILHDPELVILDEPFSGLDPVNSQVLKETVIDLARTGKTVLFSTHIMEQAERLCDSVCIIARGTKVVDGPLADIKRQHGGSNVIVAAERSASLDGVLADTRLVKRADNYGNYAELELAAGAQPQQVLEALVRQGVTVSRFEIAEPTLHKIFIDLAGPQAQPGSPEEATHA